MSDEATKFISIIHDFLNENQAKELLTRLDEEIGQSTEKAEVKNFFKTLRSSVDKSPKTWRFKLLTFMLWATIVIHFLIVFGNLTAFFYLPFAIPWWGALPLCTFIVWLTFSPIPCPLTRLENTLRKSLGLPEVRFFVKYYIVDPVRSRLRPQVRS